MRHKLILPVLLAFFVAGCGSTTVNVTTPTTTTPERFGAVQNSIPLSQKGKANGVATLNGSTKLIEAQLPSTVALLASPTFTGIPGAPTAAAKTNTTQLATTAFVMGAVVEAEALAIPTTQKGVANGVAELTSLAVLPEAELPSTVALAKEKALGEVEGTVALNLEEGTTFVATLKKNVTFKVTKAPARPVSVELVLTENSTGGWTWTVEGASWVPAEPTFNTAKGKANAEDLAVNKAGGEIIARAGTEGKEGPKGAEGKEGPVGQGIPTGGKTGEVLKKKSNTNYDTEWVPGTESELTYSATESLATGVEQEGGEYQEAKYAVGGNGREYFAGALKFKSEVTSGKLVMTLPAEGRPTFKKECLGFNLTAGNAMVSLSIKTNGEVLANSSLSTSYVLDLDNCSFPKTH